MNDRMKQEPLAFGFKCSLTLYSGLMRLLGPLLRIKAKRRGRNEPGYLHAIEERFARYDLLANSDLRSFKEGAIWIHAVSLGETKAANVLVTALIESNQQRSAQGAESPRFLLTHSTATGLQAGRELINSLGLSANNALQVWYPCDTPEAVCRFIHQFKPRLGLLMETEVWPNMVMACKRANMPLILVNARLNPKSFKSADALGVFAKTVYQNLTAVFAQAPADAERLKALGAPVLGTFGNLKFDASVNEEQFRCGQAFAKKHYQQFKKPVIVFASSREGEEALFFHALLADRSLIEGVQWLIVPRHPQRFDEVQKIGRQFGFAVSRRTPAEPDSTSAEYFDQRGVNANHVSQVWIGDTVGEMPLYYGMASVALLGGSFEPLGGQNLIEAAACACPLVMGPHVFNFSQAAKQALERGAALEAQTLHEACQIARQIALDTTLQTRMSHSALEFAAENRGAVSKTVEALKNYL